MFNAIESGFVALERCTLRVGPRGFTDENAAYLDYLLDDVWEILEQGVRVPFAAAHTPTLVTVRQDRLPSARTVVLRAVSRLENLVFVHAHRGSDKLRELAAHPDATLHIYDAGRRVQLRLDAQAAVHVDDEIADAQWALLCEQHRVCRRRALGADRAAGFERSVDDVDGLARNGRREDFAAIALHVGAIEWQHVGAGGARRARFEVGETPRALWLND